LLRAKNEMTLGLKDQVMAQIDQIQKSRQQKKR